MWENTQESVIYDGLRVEATVVWKYFVVKKFSWAMIAIHENFLLENF